MVSNFSKEIIFFQRETSRRIHLASEFRWNLENRARTKVRWGDRRQRPVKAEIRSGPRKVREEPGLEKKKRKKTCNSRSRAALGLLQSIFNPCTSHGDRCVRGTLEIVVSDGMIRAITAAAAPSPKTLPFSPCFVNLAARIYRHILNGFQIRKIGLDRRIGSSKG